MAARIIYFGLDHLNRLAVLKGVGYSIFVCNSPDELRVALVALPKASAVVISEKHGVAPHEVISLTRSTAGPSR